MNNLAEQFKNIGGAVDDSVKDRIGSGLMYQIRNYERARRVEDMRPGFWAPLKSMRLAWQPVGIFALVALMFLTVSGLTVIAAQNTTAGDTLFVFKRGIEKSQGLVAADSARKVELAGEFFGNRVDELQHVLVQQSQLKADGESQESDRVSLAVAEVRKQLDDVNKKFAKLKAEDDKNSEKTAVAALVLDKKISSYRAELKEVKSQVDQMGASQDLDEAIEQAEQIKSDVLEVIVAKHGKGELALADEDLEHKLDEHLAEIEEKVVEAEEAIEAKDETEDKGLKEIAGQAKEKIEQARVAIRDGEYELSLTLSKDTNQILKMLYGEINKVVEVEDVEMEAVETHTGEVEGVSSTASMDASVIEDEAALEPLADEFSVGIE